MRARFGEFELDSLERVLCRGPLEVPLEPKVFDCLALLVKRPGKLATMDELRAKLWPDAHVADGALRRIINDLRRALGDTGTTQAMIRTRKGLGYVFVAPVVLDAERPAPPSTAETTGSWPFVGGERELEVVRSWLDRAPGGLCFISGEAGAGKSSVLARLRAEHAGRGRWLSGQCQASLELPPLWPFREIAAQLMQSPELRVQAQSIAKKAQALHAIPELFEPPSARDFSPQPAAAGWSGFELCEGLAGLFRTLSRTRPLFLAIEDVHWADENSIALLDAIARAAREAPLFVFATYRPESVPDGKALSQLIGRTSGRDGVCSVHLEALSLAALETLLREVRFPGSDTGAAHVLRELTGGNALFVHELVHHALATDTPFDATVPPSLHHVVGQRIGLLPEAVQHRLEQAAVLGHEFSVELLRALTPDASTHAVLADLEPALRAGVLRPIPERPDRLRFRHALLGDVLAARLSLPQRQAFHCAALRVLQASPDAAAQSGAIAVHAFESGSHVAAAERRLLCERAGRDAFDALAFDRAAVQLGRAVQLLPPDDRSHAAAELTLLWARALWYADGSELEVEAAFLNAAERARRTGSPMLFAEAAIGYAVGDESVVDLRTASLRPAALTLADEAWQWLSREVGGDIAKLAGEVPYKLAAARCWMRVEAGELAEHAHAARIALQLAPPNPDPARRLWLLALAGSADRDRVPDLAREFWVHVRDPGLDVRQRIEAFILTMGGRLMFADLAGYERAANELGRLVELLPHPARVGRLGERFTAYIATALCSGVTRAVIRGEFTHASERFAALGVEFARRGWSTSRRGDHNAFYMLKQFFGYQGRASQLEPLLDRALKANPSEQWFGSLTKAQFALERGDRDEAVAHYRTLRETGFRPHLGGQPALTKPETLVRLADVCVELGDANDAAILYEALKPRALFCIQDGALICWGACARPLGELALQLGRPADAERHLRNAVELNERLGHRPELVRTQLGLARVWLATGREGDARSTIVRAREDALAMGMAPAVALADRLASA